MTILVMSRSLRMEVGSRCIMNGELTLLSRVLDVGVLMLLSGVWLRVCQWVRLRDSVWLRDRVRLRDRGIPC